MILSARCVLPIVGPPIDNGAVCITGERITAVGPASALDGEAVTDLGRVILMPGFINAHTHLELTGYAGLIPQSPLWDWLTALIALRRKPGAADQEINAAREGARLSLAAGVTCVGDISRTGRPFDALLESPLRKICFFELISGASDEPRDAKGLAKHVRAFAERVRDRNDVTVGVSPHALYTVVWDDVRQLVGLADELDLPITMHFAETPDELDWIRERTGRVAAFRRQYPAPDERHYGRGDAVSLLHHCNMTHQRPLLAHCNYLDDEQLSMLARTPCSVALCPRAHAFFGHADHRWRDMLDAGVNVCVGTDSLAGNTSLSVLDELRYLNRQAPRVDPSLLLEMGTIRAARALGLDDALGSLHPGRFADLAVFPLPDACAARDAPAALLASDRTAERVWISGREIPDLRRAPK